MHIHMCITSMLWYAIVCNMPWYAIVMLKYAIACYNL